MKANVVIPVFLVVLMAAALSVALGYPYLQAKLSILFAAGLVFILAWVQLVRELRKKEGPPRDEKTVEKGPGRQAKAADYMVETAWMFAFALAIYFAGFLIAIPVFACSYMKTHGTKWSVAVVTAVLLNVFCYIIFIWVLDMRLYAGKMFVP